MKIRTGFVSNSSSSSFIVGFDRRPKSVDEVRKWMFGGDKGYVAMYDYTMSTWDIAERVFNDIKSQKRSATTKKIVEEVRSGYFEGHPDFPWQNRLSDAVQKEFQQKFPDKEMFGDDVPTDPEAVALIEEYSRLNRQEWDEYNQKCIDAAAVYTENKVLPQFEGKKVFVFSYSDNDGEALMEHGDIFSNLPHVRISHH